MADLIFNTIKRYHYETLRRIDTDYGRRYINRFDEALPSVTTILDFTKDKTKLEERYQGKIAKFVSDYENSDLRNNEDERHPDCRPLDMGASNQAGSV